MGYKVKLDVFEGPFDLLVYLIEHAEMNIYDIRVAEITKQYIEYVEALQKTDAVVTGEFMVLAASLIELKSKMLLPRQAPENGESAEEDPRNELVQKILEYKKCKAQAQFLSECEERSVLCYTKPREDLSLYTKEADEVLNLDIDAFVKAFCEFLDRKQRLEEVERRYTEVKRNHMSVETRIQQIRNRLEGRKKIEFRELMEDRRDAEQVVVTFLSILELLRQKYITVRQTVNFGEIIIEVLEEQPQNGERGREQERMENE